MKLKKIIIVYLLLLAAFPVFAKTRSASILSMNDLTTPSSPSFVPYPYPESEDKIIENLRYGIQKTFANDMPAFEYSLNKISNPLPKILQKNSSLTVQKIVKVENRIAEMPDAFSYLIILFDKETNEYARVAMTADGLLHSCAVVSPQARVKPLKSENEIIVLLTTQTGVRKTEILKVDLMAYGIIYASPVCPFYRVTLTDGSIYFLDYNENVFKKDGEKPLSGDPLSFINKERAILKQGEHALYDSLAEKLLILRRI
ncbi:MAG TPA: hypothetical protein VK186_04795 [Candidatus Deferrimicrobium sp.]|nr:hypothetical protein [Candidatus Kapabacteria bacterium]HLP58122.1 hypothetical protein [Candidatus Deferrimicrobium sp.]